MRIFYVIIGVLVGIFLYQTIYCVHRRKIRMYYADFQQWTQNEHSYHESRVVHDVDASETNNCRHSYGT
jgi:hypothetical protein